MDTNLVFVKTPIGDEAIRQSSRVVKRNLRMILVQVDGKLSVAELSTKIGNPQLVEAALRELESEGYIAPTLEGVSVWEEGVRKASAKPAPPLSEFSTFGPVGDDQQNNGYSMAMASSFSTFGKLPVTRKRPLNPVENHLPEPFVAEKKAFDGPREERSLARIALLALAGFSLLTLLVVLIFPYGNLRPGLEAATSQYLRTPVRIGSVRLDLLPKPALVLGDIKLGEQGDSSIQTIVLPPLSLIGFGVREISRVDISGAVFPVDQLLALPLFSGEAEAGQTFSLQRVEMDRLTVKAGDLALELAGQVVLRGAAVEKMEFQSVDRSIRIAGVPASSGLLLNIDGYGWKPFPNLSLTFDSLQAKGLLQRGKLVIQSFDTAILGGVVKGSWMLDWTAGMAMAGDATLARLNSGLVSAAFAPKLRVEGEVAGGLRLRASGLDAAAMWRNVDAELDLVLSNGVLHGVDLGEAVRRGAGSVVRGGSTRFERLSGILSITSGQVDGQGVQLDAGMMTASGQFSAGSGQSIAANLVVTMQTSVSSQRLPVKLSGNLPDLASMAGR